ICGVVLLPSSGRSAGPNTLTIIGEAVPTTQALATVAADYKNAFGIDVHVEQYDFDTAVQKATLDVTSGAGNYDIVLQPHLSLGKFAVNNLIVPFDQI